MSAKTIKTVIFDLGRVLIDFDHMRAAARIAEFTKMRKEDIFRLFFDSGLTGLFEEGKISAPQFFLEVKEMLALRCDYETFASIWNDIFFCTDNNLAMLDLAEFLTKDYKVSVLTNINILHWEYLKNAFPRLNTLPNIITSYEVGFRKPHPAIYRKALEILRTSPENVFYTDDRPELVESARQLGINSFIFGGLIQLKNDLSAAGIDITCASTKSFNNVLR